MRLKARATPTTPKRLPGQDGAKKSRFATALAKNLEEQRQISLSRSEAFQSRKLNDRRSVVLKTQNERVRLTEAWDEYFTQVHRIDPDSVWIDLCEGKDVSWLIRDFFVTYVKNSVREQPSLGPEEYEIVRGINSAVSIDCAWNTLIQAADTGILQRKRAEDPYNELRWSLKGRGRSHSTIARINMWIAEELPDIVQLNREQTFKKKEMTSDDVMVLLGTLWTQASHIPCSSHTRIAFHTAVLIAAIGGFRPGVIMSLPYKQVRLELLQDPKDPARRRLVASIQVRHNKQKTKVIHHSQHNTLSFWVTTIPCKPLCLVSLLVARALADRAFETDFQSLDDLMNRPHLDDLTGSLPLHWAKGMEDEPIIPIIYATYLEIWARTLTVAGLRDENQRPYSLRVGAGGRISGSVTDSVRNYVLGNTKEVFLKSYQPHQVSQNLVKIAFGERAGTGDADLYQALQHSLRQRDPGAPIYISKQDLQAFEDRRDLRDLRRDYRNIVNSSSSNDLKAKQIATKILWIRRTLSDKRVTELRKAYFQEVDRLRAMGVAPPPRAADHNINPGKTFDPKGAAAAALIGDFMQIEERDGISSTLDLPSLYVPLLRRCPAEVTTLLNSYKADQQKGTPEPPSAPAIDPKRPHRCLFGCDSFAKRGSLTKHNTKRHFDRGDFDQLFPCPECRRLQRGDHLINGPMQWSNHVETCHGREHAPNLPGSLNSRPNASWMQNQPHHQLEVNLGGPCLVCGDMFRNAGAFATHFRTLHVEKQKLFESPFDCPECMRQETKPARFKDAADWQNHILDFHQGGGIYGKLHSPSLSRRKKRSLADAPGAEDRGRFHRDCFKKYKPAKEEEQADQCITAKLELSLIDP